MIYLGFMNVVNRAERTDMIVALIEQRQPIQRSTLPHRFLCLMSIWLKSISMWLNSWKKKYIYLWRCLPALSFQTPTRPIIRSISWRCTFEKRPRCLGFSLLLVFKWAFRSLKNLTCCEKDSLTLSLSLPHCHSLLLFAVCIMTDGRKESNALLVFPISLMEVT